MPFNKDIIIRLVLGLILFIVTFKVFAPLIFEMLKKKMPGSHNPEHDIDEMIRRQKERLKAQYGIQSTSEQPVSHAQAPDEATPSKEVENLYKETRWGGGSFLKDVQSEISKNYSYTLAESKINAFILLCEKRHYTSFLSSDNQKSPEAIKNYLSLTLLMLILIDEMRTKKFALIESVAKKCRLPPAEFFLAIQLKALFYIHQKKEMKMEKLFSDQPVLQHFSDETINEAIATMLKKEANVWARGHSFFFEELSLYLNYAHILVPTPNIKHKKDSETAHLILGTNADMDLEEIKRIYKKTALTKHPDKIGSQNLPKILEQKAIAKFSKIQEAYSIITSTKK